MAPSPSPQPPADEAHADAGPQHVRRISSQFGRQEAHLLSVRSARPARRHHVAQSGRCRQRTGIARVRRAFPRDPDPARRALHAADAALRRTLQRSVTDIAALLHAHEIPMLESAMTELMANADVVVASHVYLAPFIARHWKGELWYDAHNVEADMKADILGVDRVAAPFADAGAGAPAASGAAAAVVSVASAERALVRTATRVLAASEQEATRLADLYGRDVATIEYAPNGVSLPDDPWLDAERRARLKASLGFDGRPLALFVGSDHGPNHEAADVLLDAARDAPRLVVRGGRKHLRLREPPARSEPRLPGRPRLAGGAHDAVPRRRCRPQSDAARLRDQPQDARLRGPWGAGAVHGNRRARPGLRGRHALRFICRRIASRRRSKRWSRSCRRRGCPCEPRRACSSKNAFRGAASPIASPRSPPTRDRAVGTVFDGPASQVRGQRARAAQPHHRDRPLSAVSHARSGARRAIRAGVFLSAAVGSRPGSGARADRPCRFRLRAHDQGAAVAATLSRATSSASGSRPVSSGGNSPSISSRPTSRSRRRCPRSSPSTTSRTCGIRKRTPSAGCASSSGSCRPRSRGPPAS